MSETEGGLSRRAHFAVWRNRRPFAGGVCLLISAAFLALPAVTTVHIGDVIVTVTTIAGVSTLLIAALMAACGVSVLVNAGARIPAGIVALLLAIIALPAANFGGFVLGTICGIVGAAFVLAWRPSTDNDNGDVG